MIRDKDPHEDDRIYFGILKKLSAEELEFMEHYVGGLRLKIVELIEKDVKWQKAVRDLKQSKRLRKNEIPPRA